MKDTNTKKRGTLCPCGSLDFEVISINEDKNLEKWKCQECGNLFEIAWKKDDTEEMWIQRILKFCF